MSEKERFSAKPDSTICAEIRKYDVMVVSGGSSGIGEAFLETALACGCRTVNISRTPPYVKYDSNLLSHVPCDMADFPQLEKAVGQVLGIVADISAKKRSPARILLVNNAGFGRYGEFGLERQTTSMIALNVTALTYCIARLKPAIIAGRGAVVNIASTAAFQACPYLAEYAATKAYVKSLSLGLNWELGKYGVKVLCVCPGPTSSNFFRAAGFENAPLSSDFGHKPRDVSGAAFRALAKGRIICVVGKLNFLQSVLVRFIPERLLLLLSGKILGKIRNR